MTQKRIFIAGHNGMVGSAISRLVSSEQNIEIITREKAELNLLDQHSVRQFFFAEHIDEVYLAAARVGGILANKSSPAEFMYENLMIECNVIHSAHLANVSKLLFLGSSCIYPKFAQQPIPEEALLTGELEPTNSAYAIAKIAGLKMCASYREQYGRDYRCLMPANLYGPGDNFHPENSHVIPALLRRFHEAKLSAAGEIIVWGSGKPLREFLHVQDLALAARHIMGLSIEAYLSATTNVTHINVGTGKDISIKALAELIADKTGYQGKVIFDHSKPDGTPRKCLDNTRIIGTSWAPSIDLEEGLQSTYKWYTDNSRSTRR